MSAVEYHRLRKHLLNPTRPRKDGGVWYPPKGSAQADGLRSADLRQQKDVSVFTEHQALATLAVLAGDD